MKTRGGLESVFLFFNPPIPVFSFNFPHSPKKLPYWSNKTPSLAFQPGGVFFVPGRLAGIVCC